MRWGSGRRGGRLYQVLAVVLTYVAIVSTYVPFVLAATAPQEAAPVTSTAPAHADPQATSSVASPSPAAASGSAQPSIDAGPGSPTGAEMMMALGWLTVIVLALPFLAGFQNIIGLLIIGIALFEAWKVNRRVTIDVTGPFTREVGGPPAVLSLPDAT